MTRERHEKMTQEQYDVVYSKYVAEYGNVWLMPKSIRDRIRRIDIMDADAPEHVQLSLFPVCNTGVDSYDAK